MVLDVLGIEKSLQQPRHFIRWISTLRGQRCFKHITRSKTSSFHVDVNTTKQAGLALFWLERAPMLCEASFLAVKGTRLEEIVPSLPSSPQKPC